MKKEYSNSLFEKTFSQVFARKKIQDRAKKKIHKISKQFVDLESFFSNFYSFKEISQNLLSINAINLVLAVITNDANQTPLDMISGGNLDKGKKPGLVCSFAMYA